MYDDTLEIMESVRLTETGFTVRYHVVKNDLDDGHEDYAREPGVGYVYTPGYATYDDALDAAFTPGWTGGYPVIYVHEGEILCRSCAVETFKDTGEYVASWVEQEMQERGEYCGGCSEEIYPAFCGDCATDLDGDAANDREWYFSDGGDHVRCGECMRKYRANALTLAAIGPKQYQCYAYYVPEHTSYAYGRDHTHYKSYEVWEYRPQTTQTAVWIGNRRIPTGPAWDIPFHAVDTFLVPDRPFNPTDPDNLQAAESAILDGLSAAHLAAATAAVE